jgi:hypothetical protein
MFDRRLFAVGLAYTLVWVAIMSTPLHELTGWLALLPFLVSGGVAGFLACRLGGLILAPIPALVILLFSLNDPTRGNPAEIRAGIALITAAAAVSLMLGLAARRVARRWTSRRPSEPST